MLPWALGLVSPKAQVFLFLVLQVISGFAAGPAANFVVFDVASASPSGIT